MTGPDHVDAARAVYDHSADQYLDAIGAEISARFEAPLDRAILAGFAETVALDGAGIVLDIGCGTGRVAAFLAGYGLAVSGVDVSARMIELARRAHPDIGFEQGSLTDLPVADGSLRAAVAWYSIIATPPAQLDPVWREFARALAPGALLLVAFQAGGGEPDERPNAYGSSIDFTLYHHDIDFVTNTLGATGFSIRAEVRRQPELDHETTPQGFVIARRATRE